MSEYVTEEIKQNDAYIDKGLLAITDIPSSIKVIEILCLLPIYENKAQAYAKRKCVGF